MFKSIVFSIVFGGPGGFQKIREVCRKNLCLFSSKSDFIVPSYEEKMENVHDY